MQPGWVSERLLFVVLCGVFVLACEEKGALPSSSEAASLARAYFPELAADVTEPPGAHLAPASAARARALTAQLTGSGSLTLTTRGLTFQVEQSPGPDDAPAPRREKAVAFAGERHLWFPVGTSTEVDQGWRTSRLEEAWIVDGSEGLHRAEYHVTLPPSVRRLHDAGEYVEFLDARGRPVLRFHPSEVRDAHGRSRRGSVRLSGVREAARAHVFEAEGPRVGLVTEVSLEGLTAPLVVDPGWSSTASMASLRAQHASLLLPGGDVLVAGGVNRTGFVTSAERFDPETGTWASAGSPGIQGNIASSVLLPTGRAFVVMDGSPSARIHDAATDSWSATGAMSAPRSLSTVTLLSSGQVLVTGGSNLNTAELYDAATNTFTATGSMSVAHRAHTATLLRDGRVLVASGFNSALGEVPVAELYDPAAGTWSLAAPPLVPRHYASATLLPDGRVLFAGGFTSAGVTTHAELYDPVANTWTATGALLHPRNGHTATLLPNGKVLVQGGSDGARNAQAVSELYDPATGSWAAASTMAVARENATATLLTTGQLLIMGGYSSNPSLTFYANVELYEASSDRWAPAGNLAQGRGSAAVLLPSGQVLAAGGRGASGVLGTAERYTRASNTWAPAASLATARERATLSLLPSGQVLAAGGGNGVGPLASAERYDPVADAWTPAGSMTTARDGHTATVLGSGRVLVVGGAGTGTAELYDPVANAWSSAGSAATPRSRHAAVLLHDGRVLVAGGENGGAPLASAELYDPASNTWAPAAGLSQARASFTLTLLPSGRVLAVAGTSLATELASAEVYDPVSNTWAPAGTLASPRALHSAALLPSGRVLVGGGQGPGGTVLATAELYDGATHTWKPASGLAAQRLRFDTVVLPSNEVLALGGQGAAGVWLASAELYEDTGAQPAWRPVVTGPDVVPRGCSARITGTLFRGISGASTGDHKDSATNFPLVRLQAAEGRRLWTLPGTEMSATGVTVSIPASATPGSHALSVFANARGSGRMVTVVENTAPVARDLTVSAPYGEPVNLSLVATDAEAEPPLTFVIVTPPAHGTLSGTPPSVTYTPDPGYVGPDSFTFQARDCGLDSNVATVTLAVADQTPPDITCPEDLVVEATEPAGAPVTYPPATATDAITANPTVTYSTPSGSTLPLGHTTVTATAEDAAGNQTSCSFAVTVQARVVSIAGGGCQAAGGGADAALVVLSVLASWAGRRRRKDLPWRETARTCVLVAALAATSASGQTPSSPLVAFDVERLRLSAAATDSLLVDSGRLLPEGGYRLGLLTHYERGILVLEGSDGNSRSLLHYRTSAWLMGAWSPVERLELSARLPVILSQGGHGAQTLVGVSEPSSSGLGTPEVGGRYSLLRRDEGAPVSLAVGLDVGLPGGRASAFGRQEHWAGFQFSPRVSLGREVGMFVLGASVGARVRSKEVEPGRDVGTELEQGLVVATRGGGLRGELALQVAESLVHPDVAVELLGGVRLPIGHGFEVSALAGRGFTDIPGTPSWRAGVGIAWAHHPPPEDVCQRGRKHTPEQCPGSDDDGDSVPNKADRCPLEAGSPDNAGCPDRDSEGDGVVDRLDRCPNEAGVPGRQGCPEPVPPAVKEERLSLEGRKIVFAVGRSELQGDGMLMLDELAALLKSRPGVSLRIEGHTDTSGQEQLNLTLSQERAEGVRAYLIQRGIAGSRLEARGYGPSRPVASNDTPEGRSENRRVEFIITH
ncbi:OmpA family protein [Archangium gephyra]|uniref:kelch repeat-containing protein n=1 Tax=Archangium gephyra TaxID=48 RepID=UPI0035D3E488